jgi:hypothetical protein
MSNLSNDDFKQQERGGEKPWQHPRRLFMSLWLEGGGGGEGVDMHVQVMLVLAN